MEGRQETYRHWSERLVRRMAALQRRLLWSGLRCARPGGRVVYSTCTLNPEENEAVIDWVLRRAGGAVVARPIEVPLPSHWPALSRLGERSFAPGVERAVRIPPSERMEGFFICLLEVRRPLKPLPADTDPEPGLSPDGAA